MKHCNFSESAHEPYLNMKSTMQYLKRNLMKTTDSIQRRYPDSLAQVQHFVTEESRAKYCFAPHQRFGSLLFPVQNVTNEFQSFY